MNAAQTAFCRQFDRSLRNRYGTTAAKPHRICYFMPSWLRDGYQSRAAELADKRPLTLLVALRDSDHPDHAIAKAAKAQGLFRRGAVEANLKRLGLSPARFLPPWILRLPHKPKT